MGLSDGRKSFRIGLAVLIQYRSVTATQPASHVAVAITLNAKASSLKRTCLLQWVCVVLVRSGSLLVVYSLLHSNNFICSILLKL